VKGSVKVSDVRLQKMREGNTTNQRTCTRTARDGERGKVSSALYQGENGGHNVDDDGGDEAADGRVRTANKVDEKQRSVRPVLE
jgi:hypothetical protein